MGAEHGTALGERRQARRARRSSWSGDLPVRHRPRRHELPDRRHHPRVVALGYSFLATNTTIGRHVYAIGGNWRAAELSGVNIKRVNFFVMVNMSVIAALAGMMWIARSVASGPGDGVGWELDAIAAVFIGGAAVSGGIGTVAGSIVGGLVIAVLNNGLQLMGVGRTTCR